MAYIKCIDFQTGTIYYLFSQKTGYVTYCPDRGILTLSFLLRIVYHLLFVILRKTINLKINMLDNVPYLPYLLSAFIGI